MLMSGEVFEVKPRRDLLEGHFFRLSAIELERFARGQTRLERRPYNRTPSANLPLNVTVLSSTSALRFSGAGAIEIQRETVSGVISSASVSKIR